MRYVGNSAWMLAEQALKIISAIFVGIYVARYLGPEQFGIFSYVLAIVSVFMGISLLGMNSILVRDLAFNLDKRQEYMGTAFWLMLFAAVISILLLSVLVVFFEDDFQSKIYILVISISIIFQAFFVIDYNFQSQVKAKYSSIAKAIALGFSAISKLALVWLNAELFYFALFYTVDSIIVAMILLCMHWYKKQPLFFYSFKFNLVKPLLISAWPMVLSTIAGALYVRIDQIMIKYMLSAHELGLYAAAVRIYEGWLIVPYIISVSLIPAIVKLKSSSVEDYEKNMTRIFSLLFWASAIMALVMTIAGEYIILLTFGAEFKDSSSVLGLVMWAATFSTLGAVTARYLTVEGMEKKIAIRTFLGLFLNVLMNIFLIPLYGIQGAAIATLITLFFANYIINYFDKSLKQLLIICNRAITLKWIWNEK